jgi:hypothetical protein
MEFLDPKEQVIDLQLTSYGRYLLSIGKFKPAQYAFFDDDVIYDNRFTKGVPNVSEELQNEIEGRIQEDTPRLATQTLYRGSELGVFSTNPNLAYSLMPGVAADNDWYQSGLAQTPDKSYIMSEPIGNSAYNSNNIAAWNIGFYKAPLSGTNTVWTGSGGEIPTTFIPQLSCSLKYHIETYNEDLEIQNSYGSWETMQQVGKNVGELEDIHNANRPIMFSDNTYMIYKDDFAFLKIEEANTVFMKENFEVEAYEIIPVYDEEEDKYSEVLKQLYFGGEKVKDEDRVDYYFNVDIDFEINEEEYCSLNKVAQDKVQNIYVDKVFNCEAKKEILHSLNIYETGENQPPEDPCE